MNSNYYAQGKNFTAELLHNLWKYLLLAASMVATVKIIFFGFDIDEQYAVSMAYRLLQGDRMFLEMWDLIRLPLSSLLPFYGCIYSCFIR